MVCAVPEWVASADMGNGSALRTRRLRVEWRPGCKVTALVRAPREPGGTGVLLAHGAGAGPQHPFMAGMRNRLAALGMPTMTFDYPYLEAGRRAPDRPEILLACHRAALRRFRSSVDRVVLAGKSMGGRMASHLAADGERCDGLVYYGYPLVPIGKSAARSTDHLHDIDAPMLFVSGARDRMAPLGLLEPIVDAVRRAELAVVADGDHSFRVPKRTGMSEADVLDHLAELTAGWVSPG